MLACPRAEHFREVEVQVVASILLASSFALGLALSVPAAASVIESKPLQFSKGASSATVKGSLKGDKIVDYKLRARAGQTMSVALKASNGANYFNVLPPGSKDVGIYNSSTDGNELTTTLPSDGEYTIRVYLMRSAARRNEVSNYTLNVGITGKPGKAADLGRAPASDAKLKGTPFHATGKLPCWMGNAPEDSAQCTFGVIRGSPGNAEVRVKPEGGLERVLTFKGDHVTSGSEKVKATKSSDTWTIEVNDYEHYRVYDAVIFGG